MNRVLIVEDQPAVATALQVLFEVHEIACTVVHGPEEALRAIRSESVGVVVQDMNFQRNATSGEEGIALFRSIKEADPNLPVLLMTAWTSLETAVQLIKEGANDYVAKPWDDEKLLTTVRNLLRMRELQVENERLHEGRRRARAELAERFDLCGVIYESDRMHEVLSLAVRVAKADVPVLITGANGTGKEKIAEILQANSSRAGKPFVRVNVGALPEDLLESELFGAEPGAYTGSTKRRIGRFEAADGGTLFLDEIGNMTAAGQVKLLRVLQNGEFERLGSSQTRTADVRVLCATNVDLRAAIRARRFREDLLFRLNVIELELSDLARRPDDILPLAASFLHEAAAQQGGEAPVLGPEAHAAMLQYAWPGNVRELKNRVTRAVLIRSGDALTAVDLGLDPAFLQQAPSTSEAVPPARSRSRGSDPERSAIEEALLRCHGTVSKAARELGISRQALYRKMDRLGIVLERRPTLE